jgi:hypothetical protein
MNIQNREHYDPLTNSSLSTHKGYVAGSFGKEDVASLAVEVTPVITGCPEADLLHYLFTLLLLNIKRTAAIIHHNALL